MIRSLSGQIFRRREREYRAKHFALDDTVRLYKIDVQPLAEDLTIGVEVIRDESKTKILANGFNSYQSLSDWHVLLGAQCDDDEPTTLEILFIGEERPEIKVGGYVAGDFQQKSDQFTYEIAYEDLELREFLLRFRTITGEYPIFRHLNELEYLNYYARVLDRLLTEYPFYYTYEQLDEDYLDLAVVLLYTVDFPPNSKKNVTVGYEASGTMNKTFTKEPVYTFDYLLKPARHWSSFGDLTVEVFTPEEAPYIVKSNVDFTEAGPRHYVATLDSLPKKDLSFSIYSKPEIPLTDRRLPLYETLVILSLTVSTIAVIRGLRFEQKRYKESNRNGKS